MKTSRIKFIRFPIPIIYIGLFLFMNLFFLKCEDDNSRKKGLSIIYIYNIIKQEDTVTRTIHFEDMKDGTIRRTYRITTTHPMKETVVADTYTYIKKCLQGQTYRSSENDCRGTGAAPDWGAGKFIFCSSNDRACEILAEDSSGVFYYTADPAKSPAAVSCANDTTGGNKWKISDERYNFPADIRSMFPEIPLDSANLIWRNTKNTKDSNPTFYFDLNGKEQPGTDQLKNSALFVLCFSG